MRTGLVSVTFRKKSPKEIIELVRQAGLDGIEWGGDVHATDPEAAKEIRKRMEELSIFSLGSYYNTGSGEGSFEKVFETACALGAPNIRVWAGPEDGRTAGPEIWERVVADSKRIARIAATEGKTISYEYHGGTLTSLQKNALRLLREVDEPNVFLYWQPLDCNPEEEKLQHVQELAASGRLMNLHVYQWNGGLRLPLSEGEARWQPWISAAKDAANAALLEFVQDDDPARFLEDAAVLKRMVTPSSLFTASSAVS